MRDVVHPHPARSGRSAARHVGREHARWLVPLLLGSLWACQQGERERAPAPSPSPATSLTLPEPELDVPLRERAARSGENASTPHFTMSFSAVKACKVEPPFEPREGFIRLGVDVTIQALGPLEVPVNPFYATLIDANEVVFESTLAGCQPALQARRISNGERASGWITFDVPAQARGLRLAYAPILIGAGREEVLFQLGR